MNCSEARSWFSAYLEKSLASDLRKKVDSHLHSCPTCAQELTGLRHILADLHTMEVLTPPDDLRRKVKAHLLQQQRAARERVANPVNLVTTLLRWQSKVPRATWSYTGLGLASATVVFLLLIAPSIVKHHPVFWVRQQRGQERAPGMLAQIPPNEPTHETDSTDRSLRTPSLSPSPATRPADRLSSRVGEVPSPESTRRAGARQKGVSSFPVLSRTDKFAAGRAKQPVIAQLAEPPHHETTYTQPSVRAPEEGGKLADAGLSETKRERKAGVGFTGENGRANLRSADEMAMTAEFVAASAARDRKDDEQGLGAGSVATPALGRANKEVASAPASAPPMAGAGMGRGAGYAGGMAAKTTPESATIGQSRAENERTRTLNLKHFEMKVPEKVTRGHGFDVLVEITPEETLSDASITILTPRELLVRIGDKWLSGGRFTVYSGVLRQDHMTRLTLHFHPTSQGDGVIQVSIRSEKAGGAEVARGMTLNIK